MLAPVIRAVIFDLDGTLVHSLPGITASLNRVLHRFGMAEHPESAVRGFIGNGARALIERSLGRAAAQHDIDSMVDAFKNEYAETWPEGTAPYPGVADVLPTFRERGAGIAVLSNKPDVFCREITDTLFPDIVFSMVLGQRDGVPAKPDPTGAREIASHLEIPPEETVFLGDSTIDLVTAKNAGMIPVAATWGYHDKPALAAEKPAYSIADIAALPRLLDQLT